MLHPRAVLLAAFLLAPLARAQDANSLFLDGLELLRDARFDEAIARFDQAIAADSENPRYRIARGATLCFAERPDESIADFDRAMALSDRSKESRMWRAAADRMCARFFTEIYPQATRDTFESTVGEVSAMWGQNFRAVEQGYEPPESQRAAIRKQLADLRAWYVQRSSEGGNAVEAAWKRGKARADSGDWVGAATDVARAFQAWPEDPLVLYYQAGCRLAANDPITARRLYTRALTDKTDFTNAYLGRAIAAARLGDAARAHADLAQVTARNEKLGKDNVANVDRQLADSAKNPDEGVRALLPALATRRRYDETYQDGLRAREEAVNRAPNDADARAELADYLYMHVDVPREKVGPRDEPRLLRFQTPARQQAEIERAEALCDQALASDANHVRALVVKAAIRVWNLRYSDAETLLKRALATGTDEPRVLALLAKVLDVAAAQKRNMAAALRTPTTIGSETHTEGDYEVTTTWWRNPSQAELAQAAQLDAEAAECVRMATESLERAANARPGTFDAAYFGGVLAHRFGRTEEARDKFAEATRLDSESSDAWFHLADECAALGQEADALTARGEGLNRIETTAAPWLLAAWREIVRTKFQTAARLLDDGGRRDPADPRVAAYRAIALEADGKHEAARAEFERALALENARAMMCGTSWSPGETRPIATDLLGLGIAMRDRLGRTALKNGDARGAQDAFRPIVDLEARLARGQDAEELPGAMLPEAFADPTIIPEALPVLAHVAWARVRSAEAAVAVGDRAGAKALLERVFQYGPSRINGYQSDKFRGPELWSHVHLCRIAIADGDWQMAKLHASALPRKRHGVGPSKGQFPELEELGSQLQEEVAAAEQHRRETGDERSSEWYPADPDVVNAETAKIMKSSGLEEATKYDPRAQNLVAPFFVTLKQAVQMIVSPKSNRWREEVRFTLQQLPEETERLRSLGDREERQDPRFRRGGGRDAELYKSIADGAEKAIGLARDLAVSRGYPKDALDRDLGSRSGPPGPAPFTGDPNDPDAHYAKVCAAVGVTYFRETDRIGATDENLLSIELRRIVQTIDSPKTREWRGMVVDGFESLSRARVNAETERRTCQRQIDDAKARDARDARDPRRKRGGSDSRIASLQEQMKEAESLLDKIKKAVGILRTDAIAGGFPAGDLDQELARLELSGG